MRNEKWKMPDCILEHSSFGPGFRFPLSDFRFSPMRGLAGGGGQKTARPKILMLVRMVNLLKKLLH